MNHPSSMKWLLIDNLSWNKGKGFDFGFPQKQEQKTKNCMVILSALMKAIFQVLSPIRFYNNLKQKRQFVTVSQLFCVYLRILGCKIPFHQREEQF